jgi:hypothetical protein
MTTHDYTYLNQLNVADLLDRARTNERFWPPLAAGIIRALADRLEEYFDAYEQANRLEVELADAEQRASMWREEAQAIQRQLDMVRG